MEVGSLSVPVSADLGPITKDLERLKKQLDAVGGQASFGELDRQINRSRQSSNSLLASLKPLAVALAGVFSVTALVNFTNTWTDLTSRVNLAAGSIERGSAVMDQLQVVARRTYSSLEQTVESYIRNAKTLRDLGKSTQQTLDYTEALNNALVVSGARAERAASVQDALGKAMAAGKLSGDNLNTVIESGGRVAELLAEKLNTTVAGLRKVGAQGKITGDVIDSALVGNLEKLREEAESMPATIGDAFQLIGNALLQTVGVFDTANEISGTFATNLIAVADGISSFGTVLSDNTTRISAYAIAIGGLTAGWYAYTAAVALATAGMVAFRTALLLTGIGAVVILVGELINKFLTLAERTGGVGNAFRALGDVAADVWSGIVTSAGAIPVGLEAVWADVRANFILLVQDLGNEWNKFLAVFEQPALTLTAGGSTFELIGGLDLSGFKAQTDQATASAAKFRGEAASLRDEASKLASEGFDKATSSLTRLNQLVNGNESQGGRSRYTPGVDLSNDAGPNRSTPDGGSGKLSKAQREAERLKKVYQDLLSESQAFVAQQAIEAQTIGMTELEAGKLRAEFDLLNQAKKAGIKLTAEQTTELTNLAHQMAEAEYQTNKLRESYEFSKETFKGFFTDLRQSLQNGASLWEAFGNAAANALQKIADKALDMALNGIFDAIFGAFGGGGQIGKVLGGSVGLFANGTSFAPGGFAVVGEHGPEFVKLAGGEQIISNNRVMAPAQASFGGGMSQQTGPIQIDLRLTDDLRATVRDEAAGVVEVAISDYDSNQLPKSVQRVSEHPRMR
jgi:tape measure domain-containing protein